MTKHEKKTIYGLLQKLVRLRDGAKCLRCGKTETLQLSHIYPKGKHRRMEFDPLNVKLLCYGCHFHFWHASPLEAREWLKTKLDPKRIKYLSQRAATVDKSLFRYGEHKALLEGEIERLTK